MTKSLFINHFKCANCRRNHSIGKMRWNTRCYRQEKDALDTLWNDFLWHRRRAPCICGVLWQRFLLTKCSSSAWADIGKIYKHWVTWWYQWYFAELSYTRVKWQNKCLPTYQIDGPRANIPTDSFYWTARLRWYRQTPLVPTESGTHWQRDSFHFQPCGQSEAKRGLQHIQKNCFPKGKLTLELNLSWPIYNAPRKNENIKTFYNFQVALRENWSFKSSMITALQFLVARVGFLPSKTCFFRTKWKKTG